MSDTSLIKYDDGYPGVIENTSCIWETYANFAEKISYKKGTTFSFDNECALDFAYIVKGIVIIAYYESNGEMKTQLICNHGTLINELNIVTRYHKNKVTYLNYTDTELLYFKKDTAMNRLIEKIPPLKWNLMVEFGVKMVKFQELFNAVCMRNKTELVAWYIHYMSRVHGFSTDFDPGISQTLMCSLLGLKKTSMKRAMGYLKDEGIVSVFTKHQVLIDDLQRLEALAYPKE